ncbi:hypothetical protein [Candidatus Nitrosocosmicus hydrocola]|uniref:hypothetical protein n=1 Tax=Candidatus Nitrosocosmicus hydrocola TaxID=1826872 RepID=UPI0011E5E8E0|nr:hypothetical protein [Candidatus Nitrosocosmicus hydrocola]
MVNSQLLVFVTTVLLTTSLFLSSTINSNYSVMGKPVWGPAGEKKCTSDFFSRTCCWIDDDGGYIHERCETCTDMGDGTYTNCKIKDGPVAAEDPSTPPNPPKGNIDGTRAPLNEGVLDQTFTSDDNDNIDEPKNAETLSQLEGNPTQELSSPSSSSSSSSAESFNEEQTASFTKKGNGPNSPVPPECPKQGPIPPDCTMKPKF